MHGCLITSIPGLITVRIFISEIHYLFEIVFSLLIILSLIYISVSGIYVVLF